MVHMLTQEVEAPAPRPRYAIIGSSHIGAALARLFGRAGIDVRIANTRGPGSMADVVAAAGSSVHAVHLGEALDSDVIMLAIPFSAVQTLGRTLSDWTGKTVVDATNAFYSAAGDARLDGRPGTRRNADHLPGARVVKAFNQLPAATLAAEPSPGVGKRVVFVASDSEPASAEIAKLVVNLGLAPVELGRLDEGGLLIEAPNALVLRNLVEQPLR